MLKKITGTYFLNGVFPTLLTLTEMCDKLKRKAFTITPERVLELCDAGQMPCLVFDGDQKNPVFVWTEVWAWITENMLQAQEGGTMKIAVLSHPNTARAAKDVPPDLACVDNLFEYRPAANTPCIYFLCDKGEVTYVGQTLNLPARIDYHLGTKTFNQIFYMTVPHSEMNTIERDLIERFKPRDNIMHNKYCTARTCKESNKSHAVN